MLAKFHAPVTGAIIQGELRPGEPSERNEEGRETYFYCESGLDQVDPTKTIYVHDEEGFYQDGGGELFQPGEPFPIFLCPDCVRNFVFADGTDASRDFELRTWNLAAK